MILITIIIVISWLSGAGIAYEVIDDREENDKIMTSLFWPVIVAFGTPVWIGNSAAKLVRKLYSKYKQRRNIKAYKEILSRKENAK